MGPYRGYVPPQSRQYLKAPEESQHTFLFTVQSKHDKPTVSACILLLAFLFDLTSEH